MILIYVFIFLVIFVFVSAILLTILQSKLIKEREKRNQLIEERKNIIRNKGLLIREFPNDYTVIDIETTGLVPGVDEIGACPPVALEIAAVKHRNNNIVDTFSSLVKVNSIPDFIEKLTGINDKMVKEAPTIDNIIKEFYNFIGDDILVGYNVNFDINFLYDNLFETTGIELKNNFIDIMVIAKRVLKGLDKYSQENVAKHYNINTDNLHRALDDCKVCSMIFDNLKKDIIQKYGALEKFWRLPACCDRNKKAISPKD